LSARAAGYEVAASDRAIEAGGIGLMHRLAHKNGLVAAIDRQVNGLKVHLPYHESDHVLSLAYNVLAGGTCIEDLERLRQDEGFLDALGAERIPDPTTAGDFCRRFDESSVRALMAAVNEARRKVWSRQDERFFDEAVIDADGTLVAKEGECKEGCDFAYDGTFGYHSLLVSLRNTQEPLFLVNRSDNRPSHEGAAEELDRAVKLCRDAGFQRIRLQGDTASSQSQHLDRWDEEGVSFLFGWDAAPNLVRKAQELPRSAWSLLERPARRAESKASRSRPENVKQRIVLEREFRTITTEHEEVADFAHQPTACARAHRLVMLKKTLKVVKGQQRLQDEVRYFFFVTNDWKRSPQEIVLRANGRCDQENLIEQLKNGAQAMRMPVGERISNWAYHGDRVARLVAQGRARALLVCRGRGPRRRGAQARAADGVQALPRRLHADPGADREDRSAHRAAPARVESPAVGLPQRRRDPRAPAALLTSTLRRRGTDAPARAGPMTTRVETMDRTTTRRSGRGPRAAMEGPPASPRSKLPADADQRTRLFWG
jgi:hypothetical protein